MELITSNAVVVSSSIAPAMFTQMLFVRLGLAADGAFGEGCIFSDPICQVQTNRFHFAAIQGNSIQFTPRQDVENQGQFVADSVGGIVAALGQTPFTAIGLNFIWHETKENEADVNEITRRLFFHQGTAPFTFFAEPDARFGAYLSKDFQGTRLKTDIRPVLTQRPERPQPFHAISFHFNFHKDLDAANPVESIRQVLAAWDQYKAHADAIATACLERGD
jgi:hypothetical protein